MKKTEDRFSPSRIRQIKKGLKNGAKVEEAHTVEEKMCIRDRRFPTDTKLLWEGIVWLHRHLCKHCQTLHIQGPRNKYLDARRAYLAYSKLRKRKKSQNLMLTRRLLQLLEKLLDQLELLHSSYRNRLTLSSDYQRRFSVIQTVLEPVSYTHLDERNESFFV